LKTEAEKYQCATTQTTMPSGWTPALARMQGGSGGDETKNEAVAISQQQAEAEESIKFEDDWEASMKSLFGDKKEA